MTRLLFVCSRARRRSATAETVFNALPGVEAQAAGVAPDADVPLDADAVAWADVILVMEDVHRRKLNQKFAARLRGKRVVVLDVRDDFDYMDPALVKLLWDRAPRSVPELRKPD